MTRIARLSGGVWTLGVILFSALLVIATWLSVSDVILPSLVRRTIGQFSLSRELNVAAWWSTALLWVAACFAYRNMLTSRSLAKAAWLVVAGLLALFSWDEIGSFHERVGDPGWHALAPYIVAIGLLLAFASLTLLRLPYSRRASLAVVFGFALLAAVPAQEYLTQGTNFWPEHLYSTAIALEEATELLAIGLCLAGCVAWRSRNNKAESRESIDVNRLSRHVALLAALLLALSALASYAAGSYTDMPRRGDPSVWLPAMVFVTLALTVVGKAPVTNGSTRRLYALAVLVGLGASVAMVYMISRRYLADTPITPLLLAAVVGLTVWRLPRAQNWQEALLFLTALVTAGLSYAADSFGAASACLGAILVVLAYTAWRSRRQQTQASSAAPLGSPTSFELQKP